MWLLVIILLNPPPGWSTSMTVLDVYETYEACKEQRDSVGFDMAEAYPYERDFIIDCVPNKGKET